MTAIFASADIAALVAAFPPPLPTRAHPSLVRSRSGSQLLNSQKVLKRFEALLASQPGRIKRSDLAAILNVKEIDWIFDCYEDQIYWSRDRSAILPHAEVARIREEVTVKAADTFIALRSIAEAHDVSNDTTTFLCRELDHIPTADRVIYVAEHGLVTRIKDKIERAIDAADSPSVNLTHAVSSHADVSGDALQTLAEEVVSAREGRLENREGDILFVPLGHASIEETGDYEDREHRIQDMMDLLDDQGYFESSATSSAKITEAIQRWGSQNPGHHKLTILSSSSTGKSVYVTEDALQQVLDGMRGKLPPLLSYSTEDEPVRLEHSLEQSLVQSSRSPELAEIILRTNKKQEIESYITQLQLSNAREKFDRSFVSDLWAPLQLYAAGIATIKDESLKARLDEFVGEYFRREFLVTFHATRANNPTFVKDKAIKRDLDKFLTPLTSTDAPTKTLTAMQLPIQRLTRKQDLPTPTKEQLHEVKIRILESNHATLQRMTRASDVLQNLIWILLARQSEGLFVSPGKDTGRMIKQYLAVGGEAEVGGRLEGWRAVLKRGDESRADVEDMLGVARRVVEEIRGEQGGEGESAIDREGNGETT